MTELVEAFYIGYIVVFSEFEEQMVDQHHDLVPSPTCSSFDPLYRFVSLDIVQKNRFVLNLVLLVEFLLIEVQIIALILVINHKVGNILDEMAIQSFTLLNGLS